MAAVLNPLRFLFAVIVVTLGGFSLREDNSYVLREDGSKVLRE